MEPESEESESSSSSAAAPPSDRGAQFAAVVRQGGAAVRRGDSQAAVALYTRAVALGPASAVLHCTRSAALLRVGRHHEALQDARLARQLEPAYSKAYCREAAALQCLSQDVDALVALASGLSEDQTSSRLLHKFLQIALQSAIKGRFRPLYAQLQRLRLAGCVFVVVAVVGQELLAAGHAAAAAAILQVALRVGTGKLRLRGSVFSALASAYWAVGKRDKAVACMRQDLAITKTLDDKGEECRVEGNLAAAAYSSGRYRECMQHYRARLSLSLRLSDTAAAADTLSHLGHVYTAVGDSETALASHQECVRLLQRGGDRRREAREIGAVGLAYMSGGDVERAVACHERHLAMARALGDRREEARALSSLGGAHHCRRDYARAAAYHGAVLRIAEETGDRALEGRACAGLGHASRCGRDPAAARLHHQRQLDCALARRDRGEEARACSNLAVAFQQLGEGDAALRLHRVHLRLARQRGELASEGRACGNIGNAYSTLGEHALAVRFHRHELDVSRRVGDRRSESSTHGNLAVAYQALRQHEKAARHYAAHLRMARELKDRASEARALSNLGNHASCRQRYVEAVAHYEAHVTLAAELRDDEGGLKSRHKLGYAHYCLGNYAQAIRYYEEDLAGAKRLGNETNEARAYCNLGLAYKATGDVAKALQCQRACLAVAEASHNVLARLHALGNLGDVLAEEGKTEEAGRLFSQQLELAQQEGENRLEATAHGHLGRLARRAGQWDAAAVAHTRQLELCRGAGHRAGECRALGELGHAALSGGRYGEAHAWYAEQAAAAGELGDGVLQSHAYANMAVSRLNGGQLDAAIALFEQQLACLEGSGGGERRWRERATAHSHLARIYAALGDHAEAVRCYDRQLAAWRERGDGAGDAEEEEAAYRGLAQAHHALGHTQQALVCYEKRLVAAHRRADPAARSCAYGELGVLHALIGNHERAVACLQQQLGIARRAGDREAEGEAACAIGGVYQQMADYEKALELHTLDLRLALQMDNTAAQCRAYGNIGLSHESLGNYDEAVENQKKQLSIAMETNDVLTKILAYSSLGRVYLATSRPADAVDCLTEGLALATLHQQREDEAKIRHRLGLAQAARGHLAAARDTLSRAAELFEEMRRQTAAAAAEGHGGGDARLTLFDLQTACYQALQRVLVKLELPDEALAVAERARTRAFVDLLLQRQLVDGDGGDGGGDAWRASLESGGATAAELVDAAAGQAAAVVYYSLAAGYLYSWLIVPEDGIVKFHAVNLADVERQCGPDVDTQSVWSGRSNVSTCVIDSYVADVRESLGLEPPGCGAGCQLSRSVSGVSETDSDDQWPDEARRRHSDLFTRMVGRREACNSSGRSAASSRLSVRSSGRGGGRGAGPPPLVALHGLLLAPLEEALQAAAVRRLVLVLPADMYLVPFSLLKASPSAPCLCERFHLLVAPSLASLRGPEAGAAPTPGAPDPGTDATPGALAVGSPRLPFALSSEWPAVGGGEGECAGVVELLGGRALVGGDATRARVLAAMQRAEVVHFATHVNWQLSALVLAPPPGDGAGDGDDAPSPADYLLTAADVLGVRLVARLVVLHGAGRPAADPDGVLALGRAFLAAGASAVLIALWPSPAAPILLRALYIALLRGQPASAALGAAMAAVRDTPQYAHPTHWAGWLLVGADARLHSHAAAVAAVFRRLLGAPDVARNAFRVVLHLVEKCLQRMQRGQRSAMYTTEESVARKAGRAPGWTQLMAAVGFRFEPPTDSLPAAVFFPTSDPSGRLARCSTSLQALLGLKVDTLRALSKFIDQTTTSHALMQLLRDVIGQSENSDGAAAVLSVQSWHTPGCHEFLASLGFDLVDVGSDHVTVKAGKQANRRLIRFALRAMRAVFDGEDGVSEAGGLRRTSSTDSLVSSSSHASRGSRGSRAGSSRTSYFNPCEVDKWPSAHKANQQSRVSSVEERPSQPNLSLHLSHQSVIRHKYSSASDTSDATTPVAATARRSGSARGTRATCSTSSGSDDAAGRRRGRGRGSRGEGGERTPDAAPPPADWAAGRLDAPPPLSSDSYTTPSLSSTDGVYALAEGIRRMDTSALAERILAETRPQRRALEHLWAADDGRVYQAVTPAAPPTTERYTMPASSGTGFSDGPVGESAEEGAVCVPVLYDVDHDVELVHSEADEAQTTHTSHTDDSGEETRTHRIGHMDKIRGIDAANVVCSTPMSKSQREESPSTTTVGLSPGQRAVSLSGHDTIQTNGRSANIYVIGSEGGDKGGSTGRDTGGMFGKGGQQPQSENSEDSGYSQAHTSPPPPPLAHREPTQSLNDMLSNGVLAEDVSKGAGVTPNKGVCVTPGAGVTPSRGAIRSKTSAAGKQKSVKFEDEVRTSFIGEGTSVDVGRERGAHPTPCSGTEGGMSAPTGAPVVYRPPQAYHGVHDGERTPQWSWSPDDVAGDDDAADDVSSPHRLQRAAQHFYMSSDDSNSSAGSRLRPDLCRRLVESHAMRRSPEDWAVPGGARTPGGAHPWYQSDSDSSAPSFRRAVGRGARRSAVNAQQYAGGTPKRPPDVELQSSRC